MKEEARVRRAVRRAHASRDSLAVVMAEAQAAGVSTRRLGQLAEMSHTTAWELVRHGRRIKEVRDGGS